jgi:hypothetical protein
MAESKVCKFLTFLSLAIYVKLTATVNHRADLKAAGPKRDELYARLEAEYTNLQNPIRTANKFGIEEIIDPIDTRSVACAWAKHM